jgi:UDP-3-O-[3-hydroxymyristoyl] N-acetylglucosamine deacetylase/UDP-3-O-[3-hydroxymyristoyl] N-acetylglucosamine deacetylase/3-hydroxyacyl-[acyl-carrier-protein] dehydratase
MTRLQRTLARPAEVRGFGLFSGRDVSLRFLPAPEHHGIAFQRTDLPGKPRVPALIQYVESQPRRTVIARGAARVELIEHVMAALAGLRIDNCLVQIDAAECPGMDGSSEDFVAALLDGGMIEQNAPRRVLKIPHVSCVSLPGSAGRIALAPAVNERLEIAYELDYGHPAIGQQSCRLQSTPEAFVTELSFARTFVLESEVSALRAQGYGHRATTDNLLVFGENGPIDNEMYADNECARHKALDCVGDLALLGCDLIGEVHAMQSGHALNHEAVRRLDSERRSLATRRTAG